MEWKVYFACSGIFTSSSTYSQYLLLCVCSLLVGSSSIVSWDNLLLTIGSSSSVDAPDAANKSALKLVSRKEEEQSKSKPLNWTFRQHRFSCHHQQWKQSGTKLKSIVLANVGLSYVLFLEDMSSCLTKKKFVLRGRQKMPKCPPFQHYEQ